MLFRSHNGGAGRDSKVDGNSVHYNLGFEWDKFIGEIHKCIVLCSERVTSVTNKGVSTLGVGAKYIIICVTKAHESGSNPVSSYISLAATSFPL